MLIQVFSCSSYHSSCCWYTSAGPNKPDWSSWGLCIFHQSNLAKKTKRSFVIGPKNCEVVIKKLELWVELTFGESRANNELEESERRNFQSLSHWPRGDVTWEKVLRNWMGKFCPKSSHCTSINKSLTLLWFTNQLYEIFICLTIKICSYLMVFFSRNFWSDCNFSARIASMTRVGKCHRYGRCCCVKKIGGLG